MKINIPTKWNKILDSIIFIGPTLSCIPVGIKKESVLF
jgi:hypothetical protein